MAVRELLKRRPYLAVGAGVVVIVVSTYASLRSLTQGGRPEAPQVQTKSFYTCDDGATLFEDQVSLVPPFDHDGAPAVRAYAFSCDGGRHRWVQYVEKFTDLAKRQMEGKEAVADGGPGPMDGLLVKKPGATAWIHRSEPGAQALMSPKCPEGSGSGPPTQVLP